MSARIVNLNIGGYKFCTSAATLTKFPETFFTALLSGNLPSTKDDDGAYFIDRDGQFFSPILTWLRTNEISIPSSNMNREDVVREARFYSLQPLVEELLSLDACDDDDKALQCPEEIAKYVSGYWERHEGTIIDILAKLNKEGFIGIVVNIVPGHRQDFERPPQLQESGKLGLYMNFTGLKITKYAAVQSLLAKFFRKRGISGYFKPNETNSNSLSSGSTGNGTSSSNTTNNPGFNSNTTSAFSVLAGGGICSGGVTSNSNNATNSNSSSGCQLYLWWQSPDLHREGDIVYF